MSLRTDAYQVDQDFTLDLDVAKAETRDGRRFLTGVASGTQEDQDGERVSKRCIEDMARQAVRGLKLVAGDHRQDWHNEIGDVVKLSHDPEHDELAVEAELPAPGDDPLADKAFKRAQDGDLGFSIGGKLRGFFFEQVPGVGKRRKVLDQIGLRHMVLTKKPSYRQSFANAVAKTIGDPQFTEGDWHEADDEPVQKFVIERLDVAKDSSGTSQDDDTEGSGGEKGKRDMDVNGPAGKAKKPETDETKPAEDLPKADLRRMACPNCGHEFAADMPADKEPPPDNDGDDDHDQEAGKRASEDDMDIDKSLTTLRALVSGEEPEAAKTEKPEPEVAKTEEPNGAVDLGEVTKTLGTLERMIAASHGASEDRIMDVAKGVKDGFELVAKAINETRAMIGELPQGRKSVARTAPQGTPTRHEVEGGEVAKTTDPEDVEKQVADIDDPLEAMKTLNFAQRGVISTGVGG